MHFVDLPFFDNGFNPETDLNAEEFNATWAIDMILKNLKKAKPIR